MSELTLRAGDAQPSSSVSEYALDGSGLGLVAKRRTGTVSIDVVDVVGVQASVAKRCGHCPGCPRSLRIGLSDVSPVGACAISKHLSINLGPTRLCVF